MLQTPSRHEQVTDRENGEHRRRKRHTKETREKPLQRRSRAPLDLFMQLLHSGMLPNEGSLTLPPASPSPATGRL